MKKSIVTMIAIAFSGLALADDVNKVDPFSGEELRLQALNKELLVQKAVNESLRQQLALVTTKGDIETTQVRSEHERKKIMRDIEKLNDNKPPVTPVSIVPGATPLPLAAPEMVKPSTVQQSVANAPKAAKKEVAKPDTVLGSIQFGSDKQYFIEKPDGQFATSKDVSATAVPVAQTGFYTTVKQSDAPTNGDVRQGVNPPFGGSRPAMAGSVPIALPQLATPNGNMTMPPQGFNNVPTVGGY